MKISSYIFLTAIIIASLNCSSATNTTTTTTTTTIQNANGGAPTNSGVTIVAESQTMKQVTDEPDTPETRKEKEAIDALVKDLYAQHDARKSPFFQTKNRALVDKYFDKNLADLIWKDANEYEGEIGAIEFDPLYNAQDTDIKNFAVAPPRVNGDKGSVIVSFENRKEKQTVLYKLARQNSVWKISDIEYEAGMQLAGIFKEHESHMNSRKISTGEFEGTYRVGETTCEVKPVNAAFEVKWKAGKGTEMFFADERDSDKITFSSAAKKGKPNVFSFDNEEYNVGTFYRADGKEFPLKRIK